MAEAVGEPAGRDQQRRDDDEVAVEHPGERVAPGAGKEAEMSGKAMLTIVVSRKATKAPAQAIATALSMTMVIHRRGDYDYVRGHRRESAETAKAIEPRSAATAASGCSTAPRRLLAEKGYAGMELRDVAERGEAPRGSIYHHFPGGKAQLAAEAAELEGARDPRPRSSARSPSAA